MWDYSEKVKEHFLHPRNVGEIADPDAVGEVGNITCGDALKLTLKIENDCGTALGVVVGALAPPVADSACSEM